MKILLSSTIYFLILIFTFLSTKVGAEGSSDASPADGTTKPYEIYVTDRNVPDIQYEDDAISCYENSHALHPTDTEAFYEDFSECYNSKHKMANGWKISKGCTYVYNPNKDSQYVELFVRDSGGERTLRIFS